MRFKKLVNAFIAVGLVSVNILGCVLPVIAADEEDPTIHNESPTIINGDDDDPNNDIVLYKIVESVDGWANKWKVTLRVEAPAVTMTSDTVVVIDRSNSMVGARLTEAKNAADSLAEKLLPAGNTVNRVAVVSFGSDVDTEIGFNGAYSNVSNAISGISINSSNGGTFTQAGLREAVNLINSSTANYKNIILLSDGVPTYSYRINNVGNHLQNGGPGAYTNQRETAIISNASIFDYTNRVGNGGQNAPEGQEMWYQYWSSGFPSYEHRYYNHGNSTISEANFFNATGVGNLYTIAFNAGSQGEEVLRQMATSSDTFFPAATGQLETIFNKIAGSISSLVNNANIHDEMGVGVTTEDGETELNWTSPTFTLEGNKYVWEESYFVEMNEEVLKQKPTDGFYSLNKQATLTYNNGQTADFPIPKAKPFDLDVEKTLYVDGQQTDDKDFRIKVSGNGEEETYDIKSGSHHKMLIPMPIKLGEEYTITEIGVGSNNTIPFEYYDEPEYTVIYNGEEQSGNTFSIDEHHGDIINVKIVNNYETTTVSASKVWDDVDDQDGLRSSYDDLFVVVKDGSNYVGMKELALENDSYTFANLHKNRNGTPISYKVVEASSCEEDDSGAITCEEEFDGNNGEVPIDEDSNYTVAVGQNNVITNKHIPATVKITVNKNWDDDKNRDGLRVDNKMVEFCVTGKVNGETVYRKTCQTASSLIDKIEIEFSGLPKFNNGNEIKYLVEESEFFGYNVTGLPEDAFTVEDEAKNLNVINAHTPETVDILIQKIWNDNDDNDRKRPEQINATLTGGDEDVPVTIKQSDKVEGECEEWCVLLTDLYKNKQGAAIKYNVTEDEVSGYTTEIDGNVEDGFTITNTYTPETVTVSVDKSWNDENNRDGLRTDNSTVTFCLTGYADDYTSMPKCQTVLTGVGLKTNVVIFSNLPKYYKGTEIKYEVTEVDTLNGYTSDLVAGEYVVIVDNEGTKEVTNSYEPEIIPILIQKIWDDEEDKDGIRPNEILVTLNSSEGQTNITFGENSSVEGKCEGWCYEIDLYKYVDGVEIEYSLTEAEVEGYTAEISGDAQTGFTIINSHEIEPEPEPEPTPNPCEDGKGCGGRGAPIVPPITPETGVFTGSKGGTMPDGAANWIGGVMIVALVSISIAVRAIMKI